MVWQRPQKYVTPPFSRLPLLMSLTDPLPRGCRVETLEASKHRSPSGYHPSSSPTYLGMDTRRRSDGIDQEAP